VTDTTVVITCFNYENYLEEAVGSALAQDPEPHVIVVDDGSTNPGTSEVLDRLAGPGRPHPPGEQRASPWPATKGSGVRRHRFSSSSTPTTGCHSERWPPIRPHSTATRTQASRIGVARFFGDWEGNPAVPSVRPVPPALPTHHRPLGPHAPGGLREHGRLRPSFDQYADWEFWVNALAHGWQGVQVQAVTLDYRRHGTAMSVENRRKYRDQFARIRRKHRELYENRNALARGAISVL
jgi:hypothetical protein